MKIIAIKTNQEYIISDNIKNEGYFNSYLSGLLFDGNAPLPTFKKDWVKIKNKPTKIERRVNGTTRYIGFKLKDETLSDRFQKTYLNSEVFDEDTEYLDFFKNISSLYERIVEKTEDGLEEIQFEWEEILQIETFTEPNKFIYSAAGKYSSEDYVITENRLKYDILSQVLVPSVLLSTQHCRLTSKETYDIIRKYIKENINPKVAEITSDYDFCFTVKKKIKLAKEHKYEVDVNNSIFDKKKRKPKYVTHINTTKSVEIFEMTHNQAGNNGKGYQNYTVITPFEAENQNALSEYIDNYLNHLISVINEPLCECDKCNGTGVLLNK